MIDAPESIHDVMWKDHYVAHSSHVGVHDTSIKTTKLIECMTRIYAHGSHFIMYMIA